MSLSNVQSNRCLELLQPKLQTLYGPRLSGQHLAGSHRLQRLTAHGAALAFGRVGHQRDADLWRI